MFVPFLKVLWFRCRKVVKGLRWLGTKSWEELTLCALEYMCYLFLNILHLCFEQAKSLCMIHLP